MLVSKKHKKLLLNLKHPDRITAIMPSARTLQYKGKTLVAVPHKIDEVRVLRNLGFDAPAPMGTYYNWSGQYTPFAHQRISAEFMTQNPRAFNLSGMGSGKTLATLWAFDYLRSIGLVKRMLVIGPLSSLERAWGDEIFTHFPHLNFAILHGTRDKRHKLLAHDFDIYIINHDGIKAKDTLDLLCQRQDLDVVVVDEVSITVNSQTDLWKAMNLLINGNVKRGIPRKEWAWGLTGTPTPNKPTDAWAQVKLINPSKAPGYFTSFRDSVMRPLGPFKMVARDGATEVVKNMMQPAIRFAREDCIDLPPTTPITRQCELTPDQKAAYNDMLRKLKAEHDGGQITAVNEAVKLSKLLQICMGVAIGSDGGEVVLPATPRLTLVKEIIEDASAKVIVFVPFKAALRAVAEFLRQFYTVATVDGDVSKTKRDQIFGDFQKSKDPHVIVAHPKTMAHSLTLTAADVIIWYGPAPSSQIYLQANERIPRPGQKLNTLIAHITSTPTETKRYEQLKSQQNSQGILLDLLKGVK